MIKLSEIISKQILNIYSGKIEGVISDAFFDNNLKKVVKLKLFDNDEEEYILDANKIYSVGQNMCVIKNSEPLNLYFNSTPQSNSPINKYVFSTQGEKIGRIIDVELDDKFEVKSLITKDKTILPKNILNIAENIIVNLENKKIKLSSLKPKISNKKQNNNVVSILPKIEKTEIEQSQKKETFKINSNPIPTKVSGNSQFLIGRKVLKTIYGLNNEIIAKKDTIVTSKSIENAKRHSKIIELTLFSKVKV